MVRTVLGRRAALGGIAALASLPALGNAPAASARETVTVTFMHVNDVYQHLGKEPYGGLAELGTLLETERARATGPSFFTFGGDLISPSLASSVTGGAHMIEIFNALGTDVAVLGNHEFDLGVEVLRRRVHESRFPWLGANVLGLDGAPFAGAGTLLREEQGLKIGFVGVLTRATADLAVGANDVTFTDEMAALRAGVADLRRRGADIVVALTHLDLAEDERVAREIEGIDLVLGGHDHDPVVKQDSGAPLVKAGEDAKWLAVVELKIERPAGERAARIRSAGFRLVPNVDVAPSPRILPIVERVEARLQETLGQPLAQLSVPLDTRTSIVRSREAGMGNLIADALRSYLSADVALVNGGGMRGNREYPVGHLLTRRDLMAEMPFGNAVVALEVTGAELLAALEHGLSAVGEAAGRFPQVSGISVSYDPSAPPGSRVRSVEVGGQPFDRARRYRLATVDYLSRGGDGYEALKAGKVVVDASGGPLLVNVVAEAVAKAGSVTAAPEGRIRAIGR
ncbi:bifunctional metallophosphatase/5'-nucleotidase [Sabulicella rubraurantiaca]|uniref:bifunctional metallophosphatase/5'-nucleotidase n=1 Tax=Sabulicella rubraurantiaca TaxID=2811429 RepID=UPI001F1C3922|nr:bifunctional UDP-sugar hydrolase/5'-nucleotidase [Sabulicella rubraurantiaca]